MEPNEVPYGGVLYADRTNLRLNSEACLTDVAQFDALAGQDISSLPDLLKAIALYGGELLPGFYDDWVLTERERLQSLFLRTLRHAAHEHLQNHDFAGALPLAKQAAHTNPCDEEAVCLVMQICARQGNLEAARQAFRRLENFLKSELGTTPGPNTASLLEALEFTSGGKAASFVPASPARSPLDRAPLEPAKPAQAEEAAKTAPVFPVTLPFPFTRFFGRETEKTKLCHLLHPNLPNARHVTLTGAGGSGKSRLGVEAARILLPDYKGAVCFVPLMEYREARRVMEAVAQSLGLPHAVSGDYDAAVAAALSEPPAALLVLDGFEQLAAGGGATVLFLLNQVPGLKVLVTSRRRLEIPGEHEFLVTPLSLPPKQTSDLEALHDLPALQLFCDRAQAVQSDFALTPRNAADVAAVVAALDGVPLALELAAARIRSVSVGQMRAQIAGSDEGGSANRFSLLTARKAKDKADRHRSLWATIAWSYDLLPPQTRRFFAHLSVFRGGWTTEAAQAVCDEPFAADYLTQLRAHSLLVTQQAGVPRFVLLDSLREFAAEQLSENEKAELTARHGAFFGRMAKESENALKGDNQQEWLRKMDADYENLHTALLRGGESGLVMVGSLRRYWLIHGPLRPSVEIAETLMNEKPDAACGSDEARAVALATMGALYLRLGDYKLSQARMDEALRLFRAQNNEAQVAGTLSNQGILLQRLGDLPAGHAAQKESLEIRLRIGDKWGAATSSLNLGAVTYDIGDLAASTALYQQSLDLSREIGDMRGIRSALHNLANNAVSSGDRSLAQTRYEECLALAREQNDQGSVGNLLLNLGGFLMDAPNTMQTAEAYFNEAYQLYKQAGESGMAGAALVDLAAIAVTQGNFTLAHSRLLECAGLPISRIHLCMAWGGFATLFFESGDYGRAAVLYGAEDALRVASHIPQQTPAHEALLQKHLGSLRQTLGEAIFAAHWKRGQALLPDEVAELARQSFEENQGEIRKSKLAGRFFACVQQNGNQHIAHHVYP